VHEIGATTPNRLLCARTLATASSDWPHADSAICLAVRVTAGSGEHGGGPPARVPTKDVISGMAARGGYRQ
jgi:hypothetical protein